MGPNNIPRRYIWAAAAGAATLGVLYLRRKLTDMGDRAAPDARSREEPPAPAEPGADRGDDEKSPEADAGPGGARELSEFLAGESWYDEMGWRAIWEREGVEEATAWLREVGLEVLKSEREKLADSPALLAGCRRRWIVVARYAGIEVGDAADLWNKTDV